MSVSARILLAFWVTVLTTCASTAQHCGLGSIINSARHHMWFDFVSAKRFFPGYSSFLLSPQSNLSFNLVQLKLTCSGPLLVQHLCLALLTWGLHEVIKHVCLSIFAWRLNDVIIEFVFLFIAASGR